MSIDRRTLLAAGAAGMASTATRAVGAAAGPPARFVINLAGPVDGPAAAGWAPLVAELQNRGFPTTLVAGVQPNSTLTPNATRAAAIVAALKDVKEPVVLLGISNEGQFLPLVAAARPVRRLVYMNACIPQPGKAFIELLATQSIAVPGGLLDTLLKGAQQITDEFLKLRADPNATAAQWQTVHDRIWASEYARGMSSFYEVCPLKRMPKVDNVDISASADTEINPAWEQATARRVLKVEPVIVPGAGHASLVTAYFKQAVDAAVRGL